MLMCIGKAYQTQRFGEFAWGWLLMDALDGEERLPKLSLFVFVSFSWQAGTPSGSVDLYR